MRKIALGIATAGGVGFFPIAPGTAGSAAGLALWWVTRTGGATPAVELAVVAALLAVGAWAATEAERALGTTDPGPVVVDEVMGMYLTMAGAPPTWEAALVGFVLFRVFDVVKPPPARRLERVPAGWGIMLDDLAAGVYAWAGLQLCLALVPGLGR